MKHVALFFSLIPFCTLFAQQDILQSAKKTKNAFDNFTFVWTAIHGNASRNHFEVDIIHKAQNTKLSLYAVSENERKLVSETFITPDTWYVEEDGKKIKYRPFEAHYALPKTYYYLMTSKVQFANFRNITHLGKYAGFEDNQHHYYHPVSESEKEAIRTRVDSIRNDIIPNAETRNEENYFLIEAKKLLEYAQKGKLNIIENSGIISRLDTPTGVIEIKDFRWLTQSSQSLLTPLGDYEDLTQEPDAKNSVLISYSGSWNPGWSNLLTDGRYINLSTGRIRRIPFKGSFCTPYALNSEKGLAYVTGQLPGDSSIRPFVVNLQTGTMSPIGSRNIHRGTIVDMTLSPDKNKMALLHNPEPHLGDIFSLIIIDLSQKLSRTFKINGIPTKLAWHPDGESLYYSHPSKNKDSSIISLLKPEKMINDIIEGHYPVVNHLDKTLIFLDLKDQLWKQCSLQGENVRLFQSGLPKLQFPSFNTQGDQIAFILEDDDHWPVPILYDLELKNSDKITELKGLWLNPIWN